MRRFLPLLCVLSLGFAPAPFIKPSGPRRPADDLAMLQGEWAQVKYAIGGGGLRDTRGGGNFVRFAGGKMSFHTGARMNTSWSFTLDPMKSPKWIDLRNDAGRTLMCIYKIEGDTLTFCFRNAVGAPDRPAEFKPEGRVGLGVYERRKR
jgi:uncharacterized protein (TIGR03067 family)